ncbi:hypothetical protein P4V47_23145 [Brevibacillus laterosporus]|uniref:hypothetical protein n=1 Tax=Brevibacillus laterosporus TaxID=1465 RepID=UPI002E20E9D8|nr:hypothetical protein [Brevibacillus laterosporus]
MYGFIIIMLATAIFGIQLGMFLLIREKGIKIRKAIFYSFFLYLLPGMLTSFYYKMYKERYTFVEKFRKQHQLSEEKYIVLLKKVNGIGFKMELLRIAVEDILTPKDNIMWCIKFIIFFDEKITSKKKSARRMSSQKFNWKNIAISMSSVMHENVNEEVIFKKYA